MHQADIFIFVLPIGFAQLRVFEHIALCAMMMSSSVSMAGSWHVNNGNISVVDTISIHGRQIYNMVVCIQA